MGFDLEVNELEQKKLLKIVTIGGGSSYTPELIDGFIKRSKELPIQEIWLVDIEEGREKLEIVGALAKRMIENAKLPWKVVLSYDKEEALEDADFVTTQFRVGQLEARMLDERIPLKKGIIGQETNGAGGIMKAFRTIPVILDLVAIMKRKCPNAWLINFTNPAGVITEAVIRFGKWPKTIGLCNVPLSLIQMDNQAMGYPDFDQTLTFQFGGLNHFVYHRVWDQEGTELTADLIKKFYLEDASQFAGVKNIKNIPMLYDQVAATKLLPCFYHRYFYLEKDMLKEELEQFKTNQTRAEVVKKTELELFELYKDLELKEKPPQLSLRGGAHYSDAACECISSIFNNKRNTMVVNTMNKGAIAELPYDTVVEISAIMTSHGPVPLTWGTFEPTVKGTIQQLKATEQCMIEAGVTGNYQMALQAFTMHPLIPSGSICKELLDEMLVANEAHLPQFKEVIAGLKEKS